MACSWFLVSGSSSLIIKRREAKNKERGARNQEQVTILLSIVLLALAPQRPGVEVDTSLVARAATDLLASRYPDVAHRLSVRVIRASGDIASEAEMRLVLVDTKTLPRAHVRINLEQKQDAGTWERAGHAMLYVSHFDSVAVALRSLQPDDAITRSELQFAWMDVTNFRGAPLTSARFSEMESEGPLFSDRFLRSDRALREGDIRPAYAIETGQSVSMTYSRQNFTLTLLTKARTTGFTGDFVKLFSTSTNKTYRARITAPGQAIWIETLD